MNLVMKNLYYLKGMIKMSEVTEIFEFIAKGTPWAISIILLGLLIYFLINPEKVEKWGKIFSRFFSFASKKIEKHYIAKDIELGINSFRKDINNECKDLIPYETEIRFIKPSSFKKESTEHFEDKVIIFMKDRHNQDENFVNAAMMSTEQTVIPNSRYYIDPLVMKSVDLQYVKNLIISKNKNKLSCYIDNFFAPEIEKSKEIEKNIQVLEKLTEQGVFTRILLQELKDYGLLFYPKSSNRSIIEESKEFFNVISELAYKKQHEDVRLSFIGSFLKIGFVLVGIATKVFTPRGINISPYKQRIFKYEKDGIKTVYLLAWSVNTIAAKKLSEVLELIPERFEKISESSFKVRLRNKKKIEAVCIRYRILKN